MFSLFLSAICHAGNKEVDFLENINELVSSNYSGTVIEDSLTTKFLGKVVAPNTFQDVSLLIERVNERYMSSCEYTTQYVYLLEKSKFNTVQEILDISNELSAVNYNVTIYPAQLKIVCLNCDNNVNSDLKSLYLKDLNNCTQGG